MYPRFGFGNRIQSIAAGVSVAKHTNRKLILAWEKQEERNQMPVLFSDLFLNKLETLENSDLPPGCKSITALRKASCDRQPVSRYVMQNNDARSTIPPKEGIMEDHRNIVLVDEAFWRFAPQNLEGEFGAFYRELKAVPAIEDKLKFDLQKCEIKFGVHYRTFTSNGDWAGKKWDEHLFIEEVSQEMRKVLKTKAKLKHACIAVVSDRPELRNIIETGIKADFEKQMKAVSLEFYGLKHNSSDRGTKEAQETAVAEWLLIGRTDYLFGTNASTFSDEAGRMTTHGAKISIGPDPYH